MNEETLLDKAVKNYNVACKIWQEFDDEEYLNFVGYYLQQTVELALKYQLEKNGIEYSKVYDIDQLIRIAHENETNLILTEYIEDHSEMFTLWEAKTRYVLNYRLEKSKTERALAGVGDFLNEIIEQERGQPTRD